MAKNLFLQSPDAGDIQDVFAKGADALSTAAMPAPSAEPAPKQAAPAPQNSTPRRPAPTAEDIARRATELGIDPALPLAIWGVESGSNFSSRDSYKGAVGGMQIMPDTYKMMMGSYSGQRDPWSNMEAGLRYIAYGQKALGTKDPALLAAGYHAGYDRKDLKAGQIPQNIGDGLMKTKDYAAKVAGKVGLGGAPAAPTAGGTTNLQQQLDQEEPGRYQVLSDDEAAAIQRKTLQSSLDGEEEGRYKVLSPSEVSAYGATAQPPKQEGGIGSTLADIGKMGLGGVYKGVGQVIGGVGEAVKMVGDYTTTPLINKALGTNYRTGNLLEAPADWYKEGGERAQGSISKESLEAVKNSSPDGDLFKPSTWTFGKAPSLRGYAMLGADVLGSMAPVVAASVASGGSAVVGGVVGGAQGGGAAASTARDTIEKMAKDGTIADQSAYYRELIAAGKSPQEAAQLTQDAAAQWALLLTAPVSAAGGALTSKIVDPASKIVAGGNLPARIAGRAGIGGLEEGAQEATETVQTQSGINKGAGTNLNVTDGTFGDFVLGALGGATTGAGAGALSSRDTSTTTQQTEQPAQARQEPAVDVTYQDDQGNTVTEMVPGSTAAPAEAAPRPSGPIGRSIEKASPANPVQEAAPAPEATAAPELPRVTITAENGQTMTGFAEQLGEDGSGRVLGDDGQTYQFTAADGVTITVEGQAKAPREDVEEQAAATETEAASAQPEPEAAANAAETEAEQAQAATETEAQSGGQNEQKAPQVVENNENDAGTEKPLAERTEEELRERLRYLTQQAKISGWDGRLVKERGRVSREINRRNSEGRNDRNTTANPAPDAPVAPGGDQAAAPVPSNQPTRSAPDEVDGVRADGGQDAARATELPLGEVVSGADAAAKPDAALKPTNSLGRTASWVIREKDTGNVVIETFDKKKVAALNTDKYEAVPVQQHLGELNAAIKAGDTERDAHAGKWFGSEEKAAAYVAKKKIDGTHEVVKTGKVRFEVKPKAVHEGEKADMAAIIENVRKQDAETAAKIARDNEAARKREGNVVIKDGKVYTLSYIPKAENGRRPIPGERIRAEFPDSGMIMALSPSGVDLNAPYAKTLIDEAKSKGFAVEGEQQSAADADLDAMFDDAVAAKKQADAQPVAAPKKARKPAANKPVGTYTVRGVNTNQDWRDESKRSPSNPKYEPTARQQAMIDAVAEGEEQKIVYNSDMIEFVAKRLGIPKEDLAQNKSGVEGGDVGMDVYYARQYNDAKNANAAQQKAQADMALSVGDKLGVLRFNDFKYTTATEVVGVIDGDVRIRGKRGAQTIELTASPISVAAAMDRAKEGGKRKEGAAGWIAKKAAPTKTEGAKAAESLTSAAKNTAAGLTAAIDGLGELFGGAGKINSGLTFDEETYAKAKPLFKQAIASLGEAGSDLKAAMQAIVNMVMDKFGEEATQRMKPYVVRFVKDVRDGVVDASAEAAEPAAEIKQDARDIKQRVSDLKKQLPAPGKGKAGLSMEPAVAPGGEDAVRFHVVDAKGQKIGKTQLVRATTPDAELVPLMQRLLDDTLVQSARFNQPKPADVVRGQGDSNATSTGNGVERRGSQPATEPVLADSDGDAARAVRPSDSDGGRASREADAGQQGDSGVSTDRAPANGDASLVGVHRGDGAAEFASVATGSEFGERGSDAGVERVQTAADAAEAARAVADSRAKQQERKRAQRAADGVKSAPGIDNIRDTLPTLLPGQQEDVAKAETRFTKPDGYGMLLTNGTGTGKTYSGLGVAKRFSREGKGNILMVVPDDKVGADWEASAADLLLDASVLPNTNTAGQGVVITTYAGLAQNNALASRDWDLVIPDEAHKLMQSADGSTTAALQNLRALTLHPDGAYARYQMQNAADIERLQNMIAKQQANEKPDPVLANKIDALDAKLTEARKAVQADVAARQGEKRPRVLFLSATPFAYEKTVDWAQGYLFEYPKAEGSGYNSGNGQQQFMMQHFGYTMRYNKLTEPDAKVDRGLMQRNFNTWLKREGALSGRTLDVDQDYDRRFVLIDSKVGNRIDEAFSWIDEKRRAASGEDARVWGELSKGLHDTFDYLSRRYLLEAIKAKESIPWVKGQLALVRKGVVYHDYKKGGGFNPFATFANAQPSTNLTQAEQARFSEHMGEFRKAFDDLVAADWAAYGSAINTYREAFGDNVLVVNGDEKIRDNLARYKKFQDDSTGPQVILVQSAKNAGWSGHDTTGKYQRFLLNLGLPTAPTMAIQQEGRIYRTGQASDAIMRYMNTGTSWEKQAFASTIAGRASTAENLGMGEDARALKDSFIAAFEESDAYEPGHEGEGKGGKERDRAANAALTDYDRAKAYYWATQKKNSKTKAQEGKDYFATPEPLGQKMVQWVDARGGDKVLEPSAGHGAIARWFGENVERTVVEPSSALRSRLALVIDPANDRVVDANFEDLSTNNKYDAIAMNPPFGSGGRTAIDHLAKAAQHLREGGRVAAIIPTGPAADKKFDNWLYEQNDKGQSVHGNLHMVADIKLPQSAFERAGTNVAARVVVIDKSSEAPEASTRNIDLSGAKDITEFFARLENIDLPARKVAEQPAEEVAAPEAEAQDKPNKHATTTSVQDGDVEATHTTGKGKTLRGIVRHGISKEEAQKLDAYTFKKDGGWFIRARHVGDAAPRYSIAVDVDRAQVVPVAEVTTFDAPAQDLYETANEWFRSNIQGSSVHSEALGADVGFSKAGRGKVLSVGRRDARRMSIIKALPELVKNAVLLEEVGDRNGRDGLDGYATLIAPAIVDGKPYAVSMKVRRATGRDIFYTVEAFNLKNASVGGVGPLTPTGDAHSADTLAVDGDATAVNEPGAAAAPSTAETGVSVGELLDAVNNVNRAFSVSASPANGIVLNEASNGNAINAQSLRVSLEGGALGSTIATLLDNGSVVLHDTASSLPDGKHPAGVQAVTTSDGKIRLVADKLTTHTAVPVLLHEAFHVGAEKLIGTPAWNGLLKRLGQLHAQAERSSGRAREFYDAARARVAAAQRTGTLSEDMTAEEFGAYTIEHYEQAPAAFRKWVDDLIGAVKAWLLQRFGVQAGAVTPAQLRALAVAALRDGVVSQAAPRYSISEEQKAKTLADAESELSTGRNERIGTIADDISFGARKVVYPRTIATTHKEFTPVYETGIAQQEARDAHIADLATGMSDYNKLTAEQKASVNKVVELGRLTAQNYTAEDLADGVANTGTKKTVRITKGGKPQVVETAIHAALTEAGEVVKLSDKEIKAYEDLREMFDKALDKFRDQTLVEFGLPELAGRNQAKRPFDIVGHSDGTFTLKGSFAGVMIKQEVDGVEKETSAARIIHRLGGEEAQGGGFIFDGARRAEVEAVFAEQLQKSVARQVEDRSKKAIGTERERLENIAKFIRDIEQAKRTGYVPFTRYGDYYVTVKERVAELSFAKDGEDAYKVTGVTPDMEADVIALGGLPEGDAYIIPVKAKEAVSRLAEKTVYSTKVETSISDMAAIRKVKQAASRGDKAGANIENIPSVKAAIDQARAEWVKGDPKRRLIAQPVIDIQTDKRVDLADVDALAQMAQLDNANWDDVRSKLATAMQARSFRKHFFNSDNVPGYSGDFERSMADYVIGMSGYLARRSYTKDWDQHIEAIKRKPELRKYAERYRDYVNSPQEEFAALRQAGFGMYIAGVPATAFANLTQVPLLTVPVLSQVAPLPLVMKELTRAYKDAFAMISRKNGLDMFDPEKAPADVRDIVKNGWADGSFVPLESFDMMMTARQRNVGRRKLVKGFNDAVKVAALFFSFAERLNRLVTFIAAARLAEKPAVRKNAEARMSRNALLKQTVFGDKWGPESFAKWAVDETQYRMGKANRPEVSRGVGAAIMQFKGFMLQTLETWHRMATLHGKQGKMAMAASLLALYAFSGIWGMPGADDLRKIVEQSYKAITDKDLDLKTELRAFVARTSGSNVLAQAVTKGASYPLGVDLTRVGMGSIFPDNAMSAAGIPVDMVIGRPVRAFSKASSGDVAGAVGEVSPNFIKNWAIAGGWAADGVRDKSGQRILAPESLAKSDIAMKAMGFNPSIVTDVRDYEYAQRRQETAVDQLKRKWTAEMARTLVAIERAEEGGDAKKAVSLTEDLDELFAKIDEHNAEATQEEQIKIGGTAVRNRMARERGGVMQTWGKERKQSREGAEGLRDLFGLSEAEE